jgi:hypothetical protein
MCVEKNIECVIVFEIYINECVIVFEIYGNEFVT